MKTHTKNPSTYSYREAIEFIHQNRKVEEPPSCTGKPPRKCSLRPFRVLIDDGRDFTVMAKTVTSAWTKSVKRAGQGRVITLDDGVTSLTGVSRVEE